MSSRADSFGALYRAHAPSVFRRARHLLASDAEAHDIVSDVFTSLYERPEQYEGRAALSTFLYQVTTHACLNRLRSRRVGSRLLGRAGPAANAPVKPIAPDRAALLRQLLQRMPEPLAKVAVYYYLDELTQEEIADILGCSRRHVGNLLKRLARWVQAREESV